MNETPEPVGRVLFVPVSGAHGMGEYARSLALARALAARQPAVQIHFVVSRQASYAGDTPFPMTVLPSSPTFHSREVVQLIRQWRPTLVVFDNAGRTSQLRAAAEVGARIIYVSSRARQRRRAFRPQWMRVLNEHWIAYPEFIAGSPTLLERLMLRTFRHTHLQYLDAVLPLSDAELAQNTLAQHALRAGEYVLVVPGGGSDHPTAVNAPQIVAEAALRIAEKGHPTILVGTPPPPRVDAAELKTRAPELRISPRVPMATLGELIRAARVVLCNGGDTLLQALACHRPCVAVPIAGDQPHRIEAAAAAGLVVGARLDAEVLADRTLSLLQDEDRRAALIRRVRERGLRNGMEIAVATLERLAFPS